jgi:hypothetical protein
MSQSGFERVEPEVHQFIARLYESSAMRYAINHSQMEVWVALEGLEHFSHRGWSSWETMGFITGKAVRPKDGTEHSIKFPDLICVRDDLCLWWEFKAIGTRTLHPKKAGGTFVKDVHALCEFNAKKTQEYLMGQLSEARSRDDSSYIGASKLAEKICAAKEHLGLALIFAPGDDVLECRNPKAGERHWRPGERLAELADEVDTIKAKLRKPDAIVRIRESASSSSPNHETSEGAAPSVGARSADGALVGSAMPRWAGWLVSMDPLEGRDDTSVG